MHSMHPKHKHLSSSRHKTKNETCPPHLKPCIHPIGSPRLLGVYYNKAPASGPHSLPSTPVTSHTSRRRDSRRQIRRPHNPSPPSRPRTDNSTIRVNRSVALPVRHSTFAFSSLLESERWAEAQQSSSAPWTKLSSFVFPQPTPSEIN